MAQPAPTGMKVTMMVTLTLPSQESDGHARSFNIDEVTGQITVSAKAMLNADGIPSDTDPNPYIVVVRAVDGDGDTQDITVTIGVLMAGEPPRIDRVYATDRVPTGVNLGDRVPTEMTHYELDRDNEPATEIDTNLDTLRTETLEPATYYATDPDAGDTITWSLDGDDAGSFIFEPAGDRPTSEKELDELRKVTGAMVTLAFRTGPDFEKPGDKNGNKVYEVTLVVTDSTDNTDELPVTVKVINSTDDNEAGKVEFSNRQPEVAIPLKATLKDGDTPIRNPKWQWYRASTPTTTGSCDNRQPEEENDVADDTVNQRRHYVENETPDATWVKIETADARTRTYTPKAVFTIDEDGNPTTTHANDSDFQKCLRATVSYRDAVDRTHTAADPDPTDDLDVTLEGTWAATERPVKAIDEKNDAPEFQDKDGNSTSTYRGEVAENGASMPIMVGKTPDNLAAADPADGEDDDSDPTTEGDGTEDDLLTYVLSGRDEDAFTLAGTIDQNDVLDSTLPVDGTLTFKGDADYEGQREYRVRITAYDPSGDNDFVDVIVDVTNVNERPAFTMGKGTVMYLENGTVAVDTYLAKDPEGSGITYSLQVTPVDELADTAAGDIAVVAADDFAEADLFEVTSIKGKLSFKESPDYEDPRDGLAANTPCTDPPASGTCTNTYQVTVRAEVADDTDHFATRKVTVMVINVNEPPVFSRTIEALTISENPDNPEKEPPLAAAYEYLLNRGVGKPSATLPADPNLDVGIPVIAVDDDNNGFNIAPVLAGISITRQLTDGLTYELSGADKDYFHVVPATGQILTLKKLNYELKKQFKVTLKATDPSGLSDSTPLTINVTDVDEVPVAKVLRIAGEESFSYAENDTDALGEYEVAVGGGAMVGAWTVDGPDASHFILEGTGMSRMLKFRSAPDYENPRGQAMSESNTNTYMVTVKVTDRAESEFMGTLPVTVEVTNVDELGALAGPESASSYAENGTDALGTYTLTEIEDGPTATWSLESAGTIDFKLEGTGMSRMLKFSSAPDYEAPMGGADDDSNTYMVTVKAEAGGEMAMVEVTVMVTNVDELGMLSGMGSVSQAENVMETLGTYTASGTMADMATWTLMGDDASHFMLEGTTGMSRMLKFSSEPDYEMPRGMAMSDTNMNTYMVTVKAEAGSEMAMQAVEVMVTNVDELDMLTGDASVSQAENVMETLGTYTASGTMADMATWTLMGDDASHFMLEGTTGMSRMLKFASAPDYEMPRGMAMSDTNMNTYMVTVKAEAGSEMAMQEVTVMVTDVDEAGTVTLSMPHPVVDTELTATLSDLDGMVSGEMWQWQKSMDMSSWMDITGATMMSYTPVAADDGYYLRATVTYTDGHGSGKMKASDATTGPVTTVADQPGMVSLSSMAPVVGTAVTATLSDPDGMISGTTWQWSKSMTMDGTFMDIDGATMMSYTPMAADEGYHLKATASYTDGHGSGKMQMATTTGMVTTVADQPGTVSLSSMTPQVDVALTATLMDADGSVTGEMWQWSKSMDMSSWMEITGATMMSYTPMTDDVGYYLRATVMYTDGHDSGKMMMATTTSKVTAEDPLVARFDDNDNGMIDRTEVIAAIRAYLSGDTATFQGAISRPDVIRLIRLYLAG